MSFNEFALDALEKRGLALSQKRFAVKLKNDAVVLRDKMNAILFGDSSNYGIVSVIQQYYRLLQLGNGLSTHTPSFADPQTSKNQYINQFSQSVTIPGDGAGGIHPPDPEIPSIGTEKPDPNSVWLTHFSLETEPTSIGIIQRLNELFALIGTEASQNADYRGSYTLLTEAQQAIISQKGSGILGLRTENSELNIATVGIETTYSIGRNGLDFPDTFQTKTQFMSALNNVVSALTAWKNQSQTVLDTLNGAKPDILTEYKVDLPLDDSETLALSIEQATTFIQEVQEFVTYFNNFDGTTAQTRAAFNIKLNELKTYTDTIQNGINEKCERIPELMGDASNGLKKHLIFWVKDITKKPDGPYALLSTADDMIDQADTRIREQDERLDFFEHDRSKWIAVPKISSVYEDPILDLDKSVKTKRVSLIWEPVLPANKYRILIKSFASVKANLVNDPWEDGEEHWIVKGNLETNLILNTLTLPMPEDPIIVRMTAYDTNEGSAGDFARTDTFDTQSPQSDILSADIPFTQLKNVAGVTVLSIDPSYKIREQQRVWVNHSKLATVFSVSEDRVQMDTDYGVINSVQNIFGLFVPIAYSEPDPEDNF
jgi:hypothetical protein